jgi:hypothetical protein
LRPQWFQRQGEATLVREGDHLDAALAEELGFEFEVAHGDLRPVPGRLASSLYGSFGCYAAGARTSSGMICA